MGLSRLGLSFGRGSFYKHEMTIPVSIGIIKRCKTSYFVGLERSDRLSHQVLKRQTTFRDSGVLGTHC